MAAAAAGAVALIWMHESHAPTILQRKVHKAREAEPGRHFYTVFDLDLGDNQSKRPKTGQVLSKAIRPGECIKRMYPGCRSSHAMQFCISSLTPFYASYRYTMPSSLESYTS